MTDELVFGPIELKTLGMIFDQTWEDFAARHPASAQESKRFRLASLLLRLARDSQFGPEQIKSTALRLLVHDDPALRVTV